GSANAPKGVHFKTVEGNGGAHYGATHPDFTPYFKEIASNKLGPGVLGETERWRRLAVPEEIMCKKKEAAENRGRTSLDNRPYNTAIVDVWPELTFRNWQSSHSLIGSYEDLNSSSIQDVQKFFKTYYAPNNAILCVSGDIKVLEAKKWIEGYFADIPAQ